MNKKLKVLFLCTGNSCRSQMAEALAREMYESTCDFYSAGLEKRQVHPLAIRVLEETGVETSPLFSKTIDELPVRNFDIVITLCDNVRKACPHPPRNRKIVHHAFEDPSDDHISGGESLDAFRKTRDEIGNWLETKLPELLDVL